MVVEMAVTGTVVQIEHQIIEYDWHQADMLLICELDSGGEDLRETSEGPKGMTLGVLGARVKVVDDWGLPSLKKVKVGDLVYASGSWQAPGSHDLLNELRFVEAARDWYRLESWDAGEAGRLEVRAVDMLGFDLRRYVVREARWERLTEEWGSWQEPFDDEAGWNAHRSAHRILGGAKPEEALQEFDKEAEIGMRITNLRLLKDFNEIGRTARKAERETLKELAKQPEVEAQKEAARQLAKRGRKGKRGKRKRRR